MTATGDARPLAYAACAAFLVEAVALTAAGWHSHWLAHPQPPTDDNARFVEAQVFTPPADAHLVEQKAAAPARPTHEATLSKVPLTGKKPSPDEGKLEEKNQTQSGPAFAPNHGPIAVFAPSPTIPSYLRDRELNASVVIDFFVTAQGSSKAKLVGSSGDEELDALALATAAKWQFRAAEQDHHAVDAKVRLRIVFTVD